MRHIVKSIFVSKKIFTLLFLGFLLTIIPILIALSTKSYYDDRFYDSKNGFFHYYYSIHMTKIDHFDLHSIQEIAESNFASSSVITSDMSLSVPEIGLVTIVGLLNYNNWSPPLISGEKLTPNVSANIIVGKEIRDHVGTLKVFNKKYHINGIAGKSTGDEYNYKLFFSLNHLPVQITEEISRQNALQIIVRSNKDPTKEIDHFVSQIKQQNKLVNLKIVNEKNNYKKEKNTRGGVTEVLSYPYKLFLIALINCMIVSYFWIYLKKKEISLRKALGASNINLFSFIYSQLFICTVLAAIFSLFIQWLLSKFSNHILNSTSYNISLSPLHFTLSILISLVISFITSIMPFSFIMKIEPAKALKE